MIKEMLDKANWLTYIGLISAVIGIGMCCLNKIDTAIMLLIVSGICDTFDGTVAKRLRKDKTDNFGVELDSLADIVSSGVFPVMICISMNFNSVIDMIVYSMFMISSVTRLAYYNIKSGEDSGHFTGVPITTSTILIPLLYLFVKKEIVMVTSIFALSILYVTPIKIKKLNLATKILLTIIGFISIAWLIGGIN